MRKIVLILVFRNKQDFSNEIEDNAVIKNCRHSWNILKKYLRFWLRVNTPDIYSRLFT